MIQSNWVLSLTARRPKKWDLVIKIRFKFAFHQIYGYIFKNKTGESLIARLMNRESYQRNAITNAYSSRMLTQLLQNFRSHPDIINISNDLFYDSELVPKAPIELTDRYLGWWKLPVKNVPILFDTTVGCAAKDKNSPRYLNRNSLRS